MKKIPLIVGHVKLIADFDGDGKEPGFEMEVKATYRDVQYGALLEIEKGITDLMSNMRQTGEDNAVAFGWVPPTE
jgi:hypothetical protein